MQVKTLYDQFGIMPQLATHMLRVAGVGKIITDGWEDREGVEKCVKACLLHDLGNIVKFDLTNPIAVIDDLPYWRNVQKEVRVKYGTDAHVATYAMLEELKLDEYVGILKEEAKMYERNSIITDFGSMSRPALLVLYADLRVVPIGVVSMAERIADLIKRYGGDRAESVWGKDLEAYIQTLTKVNVSGVSDRDVTPLFDELLTLDI